MEALGAKQWQLKPLQEALVGLMNCSEPIALSDFADNACRPCSRAVKSITLLFDIHLGIENCGEPAAIGERVSEGEIDSLPALSSSMLP